MTGYTATGILRDLRPDVALLAAAGRGNIDGEPLQGSLAQFMAREVDLLRPRRLVLAHHDDWMPPQTRPTDIGPIRPAHHSASHICLQCNRVRYRRRWDDLQPVASHLLRRAAMCRQGRPAGLPCGIAGRSVV
jgi:hypothetical protein